LSPPARIAKALPATVGEISAAPEANPLGEGDRAELGRWRDRRWQALEARAGCLADRDPTEWYERLVFEGWRAEGNGRGLPPATLDAFYRAKRFLPRRIQLALRRRLIELQGVPEFPAWPFERAGLDLIHIHLAEALLGRGVDAVRFPWFWPGGYRAAVVLSHDVESAQGVLDAITVAGWEEERGFRSSFNLVADAYPIDRSSVEELRRRGHEIGSHAIHHDRSLFSSRAEFERQLPLLGDAAERLGAVGFRSPATHRVVEWLAELPFEYDCTLSHSDPYEPLPGGTATLWPFFCGDLLEIPYTAPQDHTLFNLLGHGDASVWHSQLERIASCGGLFQPITHPDPGYLGRAATAEAYRALLGTIASRADLWVVRPRDLADWWRRRARAETERRSGQARWTASGLELAPLGSAVARAA
jgi:peptidoglycan/xylan/chitin deacetylase (PgdA/CDA1 family)